MSTAEFGVLVNEQSQYLRHLAYKLVKKTEEVDDLMQDTLFKAIKNKDKYQMGSNLKGWLYTIMRNTFINQYRKEKYQNTQTDQTDNQYHITQYTGTSTLSSDRLVDFEFVMKQVNDIDPNYRQAFLMHYEGYKYDEIAEELQIPLGTVKSRIFLARKKLSQSLQEYRYH